VKLGADASIAAGPKRRSAAADTDSYMRAEILSYSRARGGWNSPSATTILILSFYVGCPILAGLGFGFARWSFFFLLLPRFSPFDGLRSRVPGSPLFFPITTHCPLSTRTCFPAFPHTIIEPINPR
jgi:hypothetical protein